MKMFLVEFSAILLISIVFSGRHSQVFRYTKTGLKISRNPKKTTAVEYDFEERFSCFPGAILIKRETCLVIFLPISQNF